MNLLIPMAAPGNFFSMADYGYPKPLIEVVGQPMIERVIDNLTLNNQFKKIIFLVREDDCHKYHLDNTLKLISPIEPVIIKLRSDTKGALCSCLMAIDHINNNEMLIVSNADQIFDEGISAQLNSFSSSNLDAACLTFKSVHPRWSYVRSNEQGLVTETAEKNPISKNAIAGIYMYKQGSDFVSFAMKSIRRGADASGNHYIAPVFNEYILDQKFVGYYQVSSESYHTFFSPQKLEEYESFYMKRLA